MAETTGGDQWRMVESEGSAAMAETIGNIDDVVPLEVGIGRAYAPRPEQRPRNHGLNNTSMSKDATDTSLYF